MPKRKYMTLDSTDKYFLNTLKKIGRENFNVYLEIPDDVFDALLDYFNRLSIDYTSIKNNRKVHEDKRIERIAEIMRNANAVLRAFGLKVKETQ